MGKNKISKVLEFIVIIILGIIGGILLAAILAAFSKPKCPACDKEIPRNSNPCPKCGALIKWG